MREWQSCDVIGFRDTNPHHFIRERRVSGLRKCVDESSEVVAFVSCIECPPVVAIFARFWNPALSRSHPTPHAETLMPSQRKPPAAFHRFIASYVVPLAKHPGLTLLTGVVLLVTGLVEVLEQVLIEFDHFLAAHHGVLFLGFVTVVRSLVEFVEGMAFMSEVVEVVEEEAG